MGYGDEDYSKPKEENEDMSERERGEPRSAGKPGSIMGQTHILSPVSHNGPWTISVLQSMEEASPPPMGNVYGGGKCCQVNFDVDQNSHHPVPQPLVVTVAG